MQVPQEALHAGQAADVREELREAALPLGDELLRGDLAMQTELVDEDLAGLQRLLATFLYVETICLSYPSAFLSALFI